MKKKPNALGQPVRFMLVHDADQLTPKGEALLGGGRGAGSAIPDRRDPRDVGAVAGQPHARQHRQSDRDDGRGQRERRIALTSSIGCCGNAQRAGAGMR